MDKILENIIFETINRKVSDEETFLSLVKENMKGNSQHKFPSNIILRKAYFSMVGKGKVRPNKTIERLLVTKKMRSLSGVSIITVLTKPYPCPGKCLYCPTEKDVPKSYLSTEPAVMRAILCDYDPYKQVKARLESLKMEGHPTDKVELIIIGGTFSALTKNYQEDYIKSCFDALNGKNSQDLDEAKKKNETAKHRCVGLTLETRPDYITEKEVEWMRYLGATRVELGVQTIFDDILAFNKRGHKVESTVKATMLLKDAGLKICYHMMPNLPGSDPKKDLEMFKTIFSDPRFQPDYVKIYPCVVTKGSELFHLWKAGEYIPYSDEELENLICEIKKIVPYHVRIMRLIRDIPSSEIEAGSKVSNMRQSVQRKLKLEGVSCKCIRCREIGLNSLPLSSRVQQSGIERSLKNSEERDSSISVGMTLFRDEYEASGGKEIFLSFELPKRKILEALLRLRFPSETYMPELKDSAIIRELHTYGQQIKIGKKGETQHKGLGKKLIQEAEKIGKEKGCKKIAIISGVGVRDYYRHLGYRLDGEYMTKFLV